MTNLATLQNYVKEIENLHSGTDQSPVWLANVRSQATNSLLDLGFPTSRRGNEEWKYTNISPIVNQKFNFLNSKLDYDLDQIKNSTSWLSNAYNLVVINGHFIPEISDEIPTNANISIESLASAIQSDDPLIRDHLSQYAGSGLGLSTADSKTSESHSYSAFTALNTACISQGIVVTVNPNHHEPRPS